MASHAISQMHHRTRRRMSLRARLTAWWHGAAFDDALAAGVDPASDVRLAGLERALERAQQPRPAISAAIPLRTSALLEVHDELLALAALLRTAPHPSPRALALCRRLLIDGDIPLSCPAASGTLRGALREATLAFSPDHETYPPTM